MNIISGFPKILFLFILSFVGWFLSSPFLYASSENNNLFCCECIATDPSYPYKTVIEEESPTVKFVPPVIEQDTEDGENVTWQFLDGTWTGEAYQYDVNESWSIKLTCNTESGHYLVEYPSLNCGGKFIPEQQQQQFLVFEEDITYGTDICLQGCLIILEKINDNLMGYFSYHGDFSQPIATGKIQRQK